MMARLCVGLDLGKSKAPLLAQRTREKWDTRFFGDG